MVTPIFNIHASPHAFPTRIFCQSLGHQIDNCPYCSNKILPTQIIPMDHKPYLISTHVQSFVPNVYNLVYPLTLLNAFCKKLVIPHIFVPLIKNVMEQNLVSFPNSMYLHVGPYTPYFGYGYGGINNAPTMWLPRFNPLVNPITPPKLVLEITQNEIDCSRSWGAFG